MENVTPVIVQPRKLLTREALMAYDTESESWGKALGRRYMTHHDLSGILDNIEQVPDSIYDFFDMRITPYIAQQMDPTDPNCPIRMQYMPSNDELQPKPYEVEDSLAEDHHMPEGTSVVHRYPNRVLFLVQNTCGTYCRYCTRKRMVSDASQSIGSEKLNASIEYIKSHPEIQDVLLSGGDPLILSNRKLDEIFDRIRAECPHVKFLRVGSRLPVQLPTRIDQELCDIFERYDVQMLNIHINHAKEITPLLASRLKMMRKAGVMLGNQTVLLKGINDDVQVLRDLFMGCVEIGVRPYYVYQCDLAEGNSRFTVDLPRMLELYHGVRGWISGPATPTFVVDGMGGLGKMPVFPEYVKYDPASGKVNARNYEGKESHMDFLAPGFDWDTPNPNDVTMFEAHTGRTFGPDA